MNARRFGLSISQRQAIWVTLSGKVGDGSALRPQRFVRSRVVGRAVCSFGSGVIPWWLVWAKMEQDMERVANREQYSGVSIGSLGHARLATVNACGATPRTPGLTLIPLCSKMVGWQGFEPWTNGLKGRCSTTELPTHASDDGGSKGGSTKQRVQANRLRNHAQAFSGRVRHSSIFSDTFSVLPC